MSPVAASTSGPFIPIGRLSVSIAGSKSRRLTHFQNPNSFSFLPPCLSQWHSSGGAHGDRPPPARRKSTHRSRVPAGANPATPPLLLPPSPFLLAKHKTAAAGGHPWRSEERKRRCRRRASRRRARSPKAERAVVELPCVGALTGVRVSRSGFQSRTLARADGSFFVPRGGDAAGEIRAQVRPHSSIHVRVRVRVNSYSFPI